MKLSRNSIQIRFRKEALLALLSIVAVFVVIFAVTAAWYTNVAKTSSLTLKVEQWGFDQQNVNIASGDIDIYPGGSGIIDMQIDNPANSETIYIDINANRNVINIDNYYMQKKLFFYVDVSKIITFSDGTSEVINRYYIGKNEDASYKYELLPGESLIFSKEYCSDSPVKWMWTYEETGYYFYGRIENDNVSVYEYLRPIEYDTNNASYDANGDLIAVGNLSLDEYLYQLSNTDGYFGTFDTNDAIGVTSGIYYKVDVDSRSGEGVYAYLCTTDEIDNANKEDKKFIEQLSSITPQISVSITKVKSDVVSALIASELINGLTNVDTDVVKMTNDININQPIVINNGKNITLDMNDLSIAYTGLETSFTLFKVENGSKLTILNGAIVGNGLGSSKITSIDTVPFSTKNASITINNVSVADFDGAINIDDSEGEFDSEVRILNCDFQTKNQSVYIKGNGTTSEGLTKVTIINSKINSEKYFGITTSGNEVYAGSEITIIDSDIYGYYAGIYHPSKLSTISIYKSKIAGNIGICIKGGVLNLSESEVLGETIISRSEPRISGSGFEDTGDGIYVDGSYKWSTTVNIIGSGNKVSSNGGYPIELFGVENAGHCQVIVEGGDFTTSGKAQSFGFNGIGIFKIYGDLSSTIKYKGPLNVNIIDNTVSE